MKETTELSSESCRMIDEDLRLIPYYPNEKVTLSWYQDPGLCKQVDNRDEVYDLPLLQSMYSYLSEHGNCFYICYEDQLVGDCTLLDNGEIAIVVSVPFQNKHIGRRCIGEMIALAREKGMAEVKANIYSFNTQSQKMFLSSGFQKTEEEWYTYRITQ